MVDQPQPDSGDRSCSKPPIDQSRQATWQARTTPEVAVQTPVPGQAKLTRRNSHSDLQSAGSAPRRPSPGNCGPRDDTMKPGTALHIGASFLDSILECNSFIALQVVEAEQIVENVMALGKRGSGKGTQLTVQSQWMVLANALNVQCEALQSQGENIPKTPRSKGALPVDRGTVEQLTQREALRAALRTSLAKLQRLQGAVRRRVTELKNGGEAHAQSSEIEANELVEVQQSAKGLAAELRLLQQTVRELVGSAGEGAGGVTYAVWTQKLGAMVRQKEELGRELVEAQAEAQAEALKLETAQRDVEAYEREHTANLKLVRGLAADTGTRKACTRQGWSQKSQLLTKEHSAVTLELRGLRGERLSSPGQVARRASRLIELEQHSLDVASELQEVHAVLAQVQQMPIVATRPAAGHGSMRQPNLDWEDRARVLELELGDLTTSQQQSQDRAARRSSALESTCVDRQRSCQAWQRKAQSLEHAVDAVAEQMCALGEEMKAQLDPLYTPSAQAQALGAESPERQLETLQAQLAEVEGKLEKYQAATPRNERAMSVAGWMERVATLQATEAALHGHLRELEGAEAAENAKDGQTSGATQRAILALQEQLTAVQEQLASAESMVQEDEAVSLAKQPSVNSQLRVLLTQRVQLENSIMELMELVERRRQMVVDFTAKQLFSSQATFGADAGADAAEAREGGTPTAKGQKASSEAGGMRATAEGAREPQMDQDPASARAAEGVKQLEGAGTPQKSGRDGAHRWPSTQKVVEQSVVQRVTQLEVQGNTRISKQVAAIMKQRDAAQEELAGTQAALEEEQQKSDSMRRELLATKEEMASTQGMLEYEREKNEQLETEVSEMKEKLEASDLWFAAQVTASSKQRHENVSSYKRQVAQLVQEKEDLVEHLTFVENKLQERERELEDQQNDAAIRLGKSMDQVTELTERVVSAEEAVVSAEDDAEDARALMVHLQVLMLVMQHAHATARTAAALPQSNPRRGKRVACPDMPLPNGNTPDAACQVELTAVECQLARATRRFKNVQQQLRHGDATTEVSSSRVTSGSAAAQVDELEARRAELERLVTEAKRSLYIMNPMVGGAETKEGQLLGGREARALLSFDVFQRDRSASLAEWAECVSDEQLTSEGEPSIEQTSERWRARMVAAQDAVAAAQSRAGVQRAMLSCLSQAVVRWEHAASKRDGDLLTSDKTTRTARQLVAEIEARHDPDAGANGQCVAPSAVKAASTSGQAQPPPKVAPAPPPPAQSLQVQIADDSSEAERLTGDKSAGDLADPPVTIQCLDENVKDGTPKNRLGGNFYISNPTFDAEDT
ncbi:hypothetical protein CYMTET_12714 [Cymbomonas tetramitiformis]|uniref:Uncharacterized protein n=1 Tax=Cymbomonas tetramitiformis TaxID=36881 RepID=A0AAE0LBJ9_9CHLO|nr:hypothetical protein CYMTET_12714 [Cymbomonas tetramitiformis]